MYSVTIGTKIRIGRRSSYLLNLLELTFNKYNRADDIAIINEKFLKGKLKWISNQPAPGKKLLDDQRILYLDNHIIKEIFTSRAKRIILSLDLRSLVSEGILQFESLPQFRT